MARISTTGVAHLRSYGPSIRRLAYTDCFRRQSMRMRFFVALMMLCGICGAQVVMEQQTQMSRTGPADEPNKPKPTAEQLQRGRQMLETAEASAQGMEG